MSERKRKREKLLAFALFIADIYWLGNLREKGVCALSNSKGELDVYVGNALWLAIVKQPRRGLAPFLVKLVPRMRGLPLTSSPSLYTQCLDVQKMMEFTIMSC